MRRSLLLLLAACFDPSYSDSTKCGPGGECPTGRVCMQGTCRAGAGMPDGPGGGPDARPHDAAVGGGFTAGVTELFYVVRGGPTVALPVALTRDPGFTAPVTVSLVGLPQGVTAQTTTITGTNGTIPVTAQSSAMLGPSLVQLHAQGGAATMDVTLTIMIAGPAGTVDTTFGAGGKVEIPPVSADLATPAALLVRADRVILGQDFIVAELHTLVLTAFTLDGMADTSFGNGGERATSGFQIRAAAFQADGAIVAVGYGHTGASTTLAHWPPDGSTNDIMLEDANTTSPGDIAVQSEGSVLYTAVQNGTTQAVICRQMPSLDDDLGFARSGCWGATKTGATINALAVGPDDRIYGGGSSADSTFYTVALVPDGSAATEVAYPAGGPVDTGLTVTYSGTAPVVAGARSGNPTVAAVARTGSTGADPAFGGGIVLPDLGTGFSTFYAAATQADGAILAVGENATSGVCVRLKTNGQLDPTFASGGVLALTATRRIDLVRVAPDGRIVLAGLTTDNFAVIYRIWP